MITLICGLLALLVAYLLIDANREISTLRRARDLSNEAFIAERTARMRAEDALNRERSTKP